MQSPKKSFIDKLWYFASNHDIVNASTDRNVYETMALHKTTNIDVSAVFIVLLLFHSYYIGELTRARKWEKECASIY